MPRYFSPPRIGAILNKFEFIRFSFKKSNGVMLQLNCMICLLDKFSYGLFGCDEKNTKFRKILNDQTINYPTKK